MSTDHPWFFGYGSLVNRATHSYPDARPATLSGWRRRWVHAVGRPYVFLSAEPFEGSSILGLIAAVPGGDWAALDLRETGYRRADVTVAVSHDLPSLPRIATYRAADPVPPSGDHPVLLSYIDTVLQGFTAIHGSDGPAHFFDTTAGWDVSVLDDRAAPIYPRAQEATEAERAQTDRLLDRHDVRVTRAAAA